MSTGDVQLNWQALIDSVRAGDLEPKKHGQALPWFIYCEKRNVFISDPDLIEAIYRARSHQDPFMLIGKMGTGKNVFLELVAKGDPIGSTARECIDENVDGSLEDLMEQFFGKNGLVDNHRDALIHFDFLQNAASWPSFVNKLNELARAHTLYRTDGAVIKGLGVRVVGGATVDLDSYALSRSNNSFAYLIDFLSTNQLVRTKPLLDNRERLPALLSERIAVRLLSRGNSIVEADIGPLSVIRRSDLELLRAYSWPEQFGELVQLVDEAIRLKDWRQAIQQRIPAVPTQRPLRVFLCHSSVDKHAVRELYKRLKAKGIRPWLDQEEILPGQDWEREIRRAVRTTDVVVVCMSHSSVTKAGFLQTEIKFALDIADEQPEGSIFIIPLRLEACDVPDKLRRWQWVNLFERKGFARLMSALQVQAKVLGI